jgi:hypothetical protein
MDECHYPGSVEERHIQRGAMKPTTTNKSRTNSTRQVKGERKKRSNGVAMAIDDFSGY